MAAAAVAAVAAAAAVAPRLIGTVPAERGTVGPRSSTLGWRRRGVESSTKRIRLKRAAAAAFAALAQSS